METTYQPKVPPDELQNLSQEVKQALTNLYSVRLDRVILSGSYACGDFYAESDIAYMVVLKVKGVKASKEIWFFEQQASDLTDRFDVFVSLKSAPLTKYISSDSLSCQNVRREGNPI